MSDVGDHTGGWVDERKTKNRDASRLCPRHGSRHRWCGRFQSASLSTKHPRQSAGGIKVPQVTLGRTGARVSQLGLGGAHFQRKHVNAEHVRQVLDRALELDVNYLDVAPNYGNPEIGFSEEKMGPAIKDIRDKVFLVTKTEEPTYEGTWKLLRQSMKRLQTDHFDLVHLHNLGHEPRFPDMELVFSDKGALAPARGQGKRRGAVYWRQRASAPFAFSCGAGHRRD